MKKILLFLTVPIFILSTSIKANIIEWGQFNGWEIGIMENENYSCYTMSPSYEDGSLLKLLYDNTDNPSAPHLSFSWKFKLGFIKRWRYLSNNN